MASSSGTITSSGGSEEDPQQVIDERKRKRMLSNRESARRSRMRKQKHLDDLMTQMSQLRKENSQITASVSMTTQSYMSVEVENSVLRAQVMELSHRLQSLNDIVAFLNQPLIDTGCGFVEGGTELGDEFMNNSVSYLYATQPILASADIIQY